jgi:hypothetical protein
VVEYIRIQTREFSAEFIVSITISVEEGVMTTLIRLLVILLLVPCLALAQRTSGGGGGASKSSVKGVGDPSLPNTLRKVTSVPLPAGSYTVGLAGYFPTLDSAFSRLSSGGIAGAVTLMLTDTLYDALGTTTSSFKLVGPITGAGPSSRITIRPADNVAVTIQGSGQSVLLFHNVSYLTVDGISLDGPTRLKVHALYNPSFSWNDAVDFYYNSDFAIVQNLTAWSDNATDLNTSVVSLWGDGQGAPDRRLISGLRVTSGAMGIFVGGLHPSYPVRLRGNVIRNNHVGSPTDSVISRGIQIQGADGTIAENNHGEHMSRLITFDGDTFVIGINTYFGKNTIIRNNIVHGLRGSSGCELYGILASGASSYLGQGVQIYNNMVYDLQNKSTTANGYIAGIELWYNSNALIAYNSVWLDGTSATSSDALGLVDVVANATIRNNILVNTLQTTNPAAGSAALWCLERTSVATDYNDLFVDTSFANSYVGVNWNGGILARSLGQWQGAGYDAHSVSVMPPFKEPYLHVDCLNASAKELNGRGIALAGIEYDLDGQLRNSAAPDIGADEFVVPAPAGWGASWYKNSRNPILSGGTSGALNRHLFMPCVLYNADSARYEMWFAASAGSGTPNWCPYRIGYAVSKDGINWTMNPSPVLSPDPGTWEKYTVEQPMVIRENGKYKMWYTGSPDWVKTMIGYATSPDGINWTKHPGNPVMRPGTSAWEVGGPYSCTVKPSGSGYRMWYGAYGALSPYFGQIGYATSSDGITWQPDTVNNPVVRTGGQGQWDALWVITPQVLQVGDTHYMWYTGSYSAEGARRGGLAISNDMGMSWTKLSNAILQPTVNAWDGTYVELGTVLLRGDTLDMWYAGAAAPSYRWMIGHATSELITHVSERTAGIAQEFMLSQNYPNPFNPRTGIRYQVSGVSDVKLVVYDLLGREVTVLANERKAPGSYEVTFDASAFASGVYLYQMTAGNFVQTRKMVVVK